MELRHDHSVPPIVIATIVTDFMDLNSEIFLSSIIINCVFYDYHYKLSFYYHTMY